MYTEPESAHPPIRNCSITPFWTTAPMIDTCIVAMAEGRLDAPGCACVLPRRTSSGRLFIEESEDSKEDSGLAIYSVNLQKMNVSDSQS